MRTIDRQAPSTLISHLWWDAGLVLLFLLFSKPAVSAAIEANADSEIQSQAPTRFELFLKHAGVKNNSLVGRFYYLRGNTRIWLHNNGRPNEMARSFLSAIEHSARHGLSPADYRLSEEINGRDAHLTEPQIDQADVDISEAVLRLATHLAQGSIEPRSADRRWDIPKPSFDASLWLHQVIEHQVDLQTSLDALAPQHPVYAALVRELDEQTVLAEQGGWPPFPAKGPRKLEPGARHPHIAQLRQRLAVTDGAVIETEDTELFDDDLVESLKRFQRRHGLNDDGVLGRRTRAALNVPIESRISQLKAAMERWRWLPRELGEDYVLVNIPGQKLWFFENGQEAMDMRVIVGKYKRQTPTFAANISYFVLRPKWYVPRSIAVKDLVPKAQKDPEYYTKRNFRVYDKSTGEPVDPGNVDWAEYGEGKEFPFRLIQGSGRNNALGDIKFMFPNPYGVYLHDTSSPRLFRKDDRFFSSGCIRVEKPLDLASALLSKDQPVAPEEVAGMIKRAHTNKHRTLETTVPLYVVYHTAWADDTDAYFFSDPYRRDSKLLKTLEN